MYVHLGKDKVNQSYVLYTHLYKVNAYTNWYMNFRLLKAAKINYSMHTATGEFLKNKSNATYVL